MTEKLGVNEKEPAFGQKTPTIVCVVRNTNTLVVASSIDDSKLVVVSDFVEFADHMILRVCDVATGLSWLSH